LDRVNKRGWFSHVNLAHASSDASSATKEFTSARINVRSQRMGSLKKRRKAKINKHKRRKKLRLHRHKKRTWQK
jgi:hypothetical protein